uniref:TEA domain-containing protein n=1 Tax=Globodera rostochiensis TaxID=31243 RepID=A0A914HR33_GLORO
MPTVAVPESHFPYTSNHPQFVSAISTSRAEEGSVTNGHPILEALDNGQSQSEKIPYNANIAVHFYARQIYLPYVACMSVFQAEGRMFYPMELLELVEEEASTTGLTTEALADFFPKTKGRRCNSAKQFKTQIRRCQAIVKLLGFSSSSPACCCGSIGGGIGRDDEVDGNVSANSRLPNKLIAVFSFFQASYCIAYPINPASTKSIATFAFRFRSVAQSLFGNSNSNEI